MGKYGDDGAGEDDDEDEADDRVSGRGEETVRTEEGEGRVSRAHQVA